MSTPFPTPAPALVHLRRPSLSLPTALFLSLQSRRCVHFAFSRSTAGDGETSDAAKALNPRPSSFEFLALKREIDMEVREGKEGVVPVVEGREGGGSEEEDLKKERRRRQVVRRSTLVAKQVISIRSARGLGFVSQLWVDTRQWIVAFVEVRPNLLSGDLEKFLFKDIYKVGDVILVEDESVTENELKMVGLDSLVGYNVVTSSKLNIGKVRGYLFDINSGAVESLELDAFGLSMLPTSFVSTYNLYVEDILDMVSDTIIVHDDAVSRVQRLSKGIWDGEINNGPRYSLDEYDDSEKEAFWPPQGRSGRRRYSGPKYRTRRRAAEVDWDFPVDY